VRLPTTAAWVISDKQWLRRIVQNLLSNALRYTRTGSVLVAIRWRKNRWQVEVRDTGPGIPEGKIKHIFEEFQRGGESSPWGEKGMGLGLAIVDRMARILGHDIAVRSSSGRGACFSLNLERTEAAIGQHVESTNDSALQTSELNGLRVLCIDNEPAILAGMQALLSRWGCIVSLAGTGHEAEQALTSSNAQVILSDYHLANDEDGLALLIRLAKGRVGALVTADHSDEVALAVKQAGLGLLRKPLKPAALRAFLSANL
ncbi:MAG: ATP-binding protein, partial [Moraxellaceae bacterium]|nr:ATP-binding protein [Moraxellaceae bacterium]